LTEEEGRRILADEMTESTDNTEKPVRALLIGIQDSETGETDAKALLAELKGLTDTLGVEVVGMEW
jgi:hypothetical protein